MRPLHLIHAGASRRVGHVRDSAIRLARPRSSRDSNSDPAADRIKSRIIHLVEERPSWRTRSHERILELFQKALAPGIVIGVEMRSRPRRSRPRSNPRAAQGGQPRYAAGPAPGSAGDASMRQPSNRRARKRHQLRPLHLIHGGASVCLVPVVRRRPAAACVPQCAYRRQAGPPPSIRRRTDHRDAPRAAAARRRCTAPRRISARMAIRGARSCRKPGIATP